MKKEILYNLALFFSFIFLLGASHGQLIPRNSDKPEYRDFTSANGKTIKALLIDKTEDTLTLKLPNGKSATLSYEKLSKEDQEYVRKWDKEKDELPPEEVYRALFEELAYGDKIQVGRALTRMNYSKSGWKSLIKKTSRAIKKAVKKDESVVNAIEGIGFLS